MDWVLPAFDAETSFPQSIEEELKRLQVLKSYLVLDAKSEEAFERITHLAARIFDAPFSIVSLVDLGRNFFMSNFGFKTMSPDARDIPRKFAFCTRKLQSTSRFALIVLLDLTENKLCFTFEKKHSKTRRTFLLSLTLPKTFVSRIIHLSPVLHL
jgi:hypothetical protein